MAELEWFPVYVDRWVNSAEISAMLPEQEGAYWRLLLIAWGDGTREPRLEDNTAKLAVQSRLGARWKRLGASVREQFESRDGYLYNAVQLEVWHEQQQKHAATIARASAGGKANAVRTKRLKSATSTSQEVLNPTDKEVEEAVQPSTKVVLASAPNGALGVVSPRASAPQLVVYHPDDGLAAKYAQRLAELVDLWTAKHPDDAAELERISRRDMGLPDGQLSGFAAAALRERMTSSVRSLNPAWPPQEQWIAQQRVNAMESETLQTADVA